MTYRTDRFLFLVLAGALAGAGCGQTASGQPGRAGGAGGPAVGIKTTTVQKMAIQRQVDLAGTLLSPDQARVSAEVPGVVLKVHVQIGSEVRKGDPLVDIDSKELALALARAESALRQTRAQLGMHGPIAEGDTPPPDEEIGSVRTAAANLADAKAAYDRAKALNASKLSSQVDLQTAETRTKVAEAAYQSAVDQVRGTKALLQDRRASYDLAHKKLADATVRAPITGVVSDSPLQVGEYISERAMVATIVQVNPLKLRTGVQERHAGVISPGQPVEFRVESFGDTLFHGKVAYVAPSLDQTMRTFTVEALVDNGDRRLKPGFFAKGVIQTRRDEDVMAVPDTAISTLAGVSSVYVVKDGKIAQQSVTLGVRQGNLWEILDGLKGDETLAASRLNELATGIRVGPEKAATEGSGADGKGGKPGEGGRRGGRRGGGAGK